MNKVFKEEELREIEQAVEKVESSYAVEIVPVFSGKSSVYIIARFRVLLFGIVSGLVLITLLDFYTGLSWVPFYVKTTMLAVWIAFFMTIFEFIPALNKRLIGKEVMFHETRERAKVEFVNQSVYRNKNRIGVMIYMSFYEQQFHILSDDKGTKFLAEQEWLELSNGLTDNLKQDNPSKAIIKCINEIGNIMKQISDSSDDLPPTILSNELRFE